jgi:hypothetical protein
VAAFLKKAAQKFLLFRASGVEIARAKRCFRATDPKQQKFLRRFFQKAATCLLQT